MASACDHGGDAYRDLLSGANARPSWSRFGGSSGKAPPMGLLGVGRRGSRVHHHYAMAAAAPLGRGMFRGYPGMIILGGSTRESLI